MPGGAGPKGGSPGAGFSKTNCDELKRRNEEERQKFVDSLEKKRKREGLNKEEKRELRKAKRGGMTYSSAQSSCGGQTSTMTQSSSGLANASISQSLDGGTAAQKVGLNQKIRDSEAKRYEPRKKRAGTLCNGSYLHPGGGKGAHAESKIFNNLSNQQGGGSMQGCSTLLNIDWRKNSPSGGVVKSGMPCEDCQRMLCHAAKKCKVEIMICDKDNKPTKLSDEDCKGASGRQKLCKRVDGGFKPGRF